MDKFCTYYPFVCETKRTVDLRWVLWTPVIYILLSFLEQYPSVTTWVLMLAKVTMDLRGQIPLILFSLCFLSLYFFSFHKVKLLFFYIQVRSNMFTLSIFSFETRENITKYVWLFPLILVLLFLYITKRMMAKLRFGYQLLREIQRLYFFYYTCIYIQPHVLMWCSLLKT